MPDFDITPAVLQQIATIETRYGKALNEDISEAFPDNPDMAYAVATGFGLATLLHAFSNPAERAVMVDGINMLVRQAGYALTPVT